MIPLKSFTVPSKTFFLFHKVIKRSLVNQTAAKEVYISESNNVFTNLALEDWVYRNRDFSKKNSLLLLWINKPCVVIGRHQNPWVEANLKHLCDLNVELARRNSGGGTVYHDLGNLNCTFFSSRDTYNRKKNLELICEALRNNWSLDVSVSPREDIVLEEKYKISGTASKLGSRSAYHHCTLLINVDSSKLHHSISAEQLGLESKATSSVRSATLNLGEKVFSMTVDEVSSVIGKQYLGENQVPVTRISPTDLNFPGINILRSEFSSWQWIYGKTPKFDVNWPLGTKQSFLHLGIHKGAIEKVEFSGTNLDEGDLQAWKNLLSNNKLNRELYEIVHKNEPQFTENIDNLRIKFLLTSMCSITL